MKFVLVLLVEHDISQEKEKKKKLILLELRIWQEGHRKWKKRIKSQRYKSCYSLKEGSRETDRAGEAHTAFPMCWHPVWDSGKGFSFFFFDLCWQSYVSALYFFFFIICGYIFFFFSLIENYLISIHVFPILNPPPSSLPTPSLWVFLQASVVSI